MSRTDNISIKNSLSADEVITKISSKTKAISGCLGYAMATTYGTESELVGEVNRNRIIVARARPLTHNSSKPVFAGGVIEDATGTVLKGRFEYNCFRSYFLWVSGVVFVSAEIFVLLGVLAPENRPLLSLRNIFVVGILPSLSLAAYVFTRYTKDSFFESDQKWIEEELRRLVA